MDDFLVSDQRMRQSRNRIVARNALIEDINIDNRTGFVTISYGVPSEFNMIMMELVTLVVDRNTVIQDCMGQSLRISDLRVGMVVDAVFSTAMTRSIPPQSTAFRITVISDSNETFFKEGRVLEVDPVFNFLYVGEPNDMLSQIRFVVNNQTDIRDRRGNRISLRDLRPGNFVRVQYADFMTMSIPPQTVAYAIQLL